MPEKKAIFINVAMGLGGNISLTYVTKELKEKYSYVAVCSPYKDIFEVDPNVDAVYGPDNMRDFVFDAKAKGAKIIMHRLYDMSDFIYKRISYSDAWRELCGIQVLGDEEGSTGIHNYEVFKKYPYLEKQFEDLKKQILTKDVKGFILVNFEGGVSPLSQPQIKTVKNEEGKDVQMPDWSSIPDPYGNEPLARNYPRESASEFIKLFKEKHPDIAVVNFSMPNQANYNVGDLKFITPYLLYYELSKLTECKGAVTIDSALQHLITDNCKIITLWGHSAPVSFGHKSDKTKNIIQPCRKDDILYFSALGPSGAKVEYIKPEELLDYTEDWLMN